MAYRNDIFKPGTKEKPGHYYAPAGEDFMTKWNLRPGDMVGIKQGPNGENFMNNIDIGNASLRGITFINDASNTKPIEIGWFGMGSRCVDVKFLGNGVPSIPYGFKLWDPKQLGISFGCVGDIEVAYIEVGGAAMGMQLSTKIGAAYVYPVNYQRAHIHHLYIHDVSDEAMYLGWVNDSPILMELNIHDIKIRNAGRDGIQTRNTRKVLIENCDLDGIGTRGDWGHDHGVLFGNCIDGAVMRNVKMRNVHGCGIFNGGFGEFVIENNDIESKSPSIFARAYNPDRATSDWGDSEKIGFQRHIVTGNVLTPANGVATEVLVKPEAGKRVEFIAKNNKTSGKWNMPASVIKTLENNGPDVSTKPVPVPVPVPEPVPVPTAKKVVAEMYDDGTWAYKK